MHKVKLFFRAIIADIDIKQSIGYIVLTFATISAGLIGSALIILSIYAINYLTN